MKSQKINHVFEEFKTKDNNEPAKISLKLEFYGERGLGASGKYQVQVYKNDKEVDSGCLLELPISKEGKLQVKHSKYINPDLANCIDFTDSSERKIVSIV